MTAGSGCARERFRHCGSHWPAAEQLLEIELLNPSEARGIWAMYDYVELKPSRGIRGYGHYHEEYRKEGGNWHICKLKLTRLRVDPLG